MIPGEIFTADDDILLNAGCETLSIKVVNAGDRPIQIGSHYHFYEVNQALQFERAETRGWRLNITAGTAVRFEPGQSRTVELIEFIGSRTIFGFRGQIMGKLDEKGK